MLIHKCFDETLKKYAITGAALAREAKISSSHVSQFRNGKGGDVTNTSLEKMLGAMERLAPGSRLYFCLLLAGKNPVEFLSNSSPTDLPSLVLSASRDEKAQILDTLAKWIAANRESDLVGLAEAV